MATCRLVWFRDDLRLADHPAYAAAVAGVEPVVAVHVRETPMGAAADWWRERSLDRLHADLARRGVPLIRQEGPATTAIPDVARALAATMVFWNARTDPFGAAVDRTTRTALAAQGIGVSETASDLLFPPASLVSGTGSPYRVFTPFWKRCLSLAEPDRPSPGAQLRPPPFTGGLPPSRQIRPEPRWAEGLRAHWTPGEAGGQDRLDHLLRVVDSYREGRNRPADDLTSRLSPHLRFGEISPRQVWHAVRAVAPETGEAFLRQLGWREFARAVLRSAPNLDTHPLDRRFEAFAWHSDPRALRAWQRGETGFPIVDAGMRQLWACGWMHNRVRMIVGSFLVKDLLQPWQNGLQWFDDTLVDADTANNAFNWQWVAGCGADAAPFFRIFNPHTQSETFDPNGVYIRRWVPELAKLPDRWIHRPSAAAPIELAVAGVRLGVTYPLPIVDHAERRSRAMAAFSALS